MTLLLGLWLAAAVPPIVSLTDDALYADRARGVEVRYVVTPESVDFSADLPADWTFMIKIDGDRNGIWGYGAHPAGNDHETSGDRAFGQDSSNGIFCAQYILSAGANDPDGVYVSSACSGYPSHGHVEMTQMDSRGHARITLKIPLTEVFGADRDAHLQACVWDTHRWTCQHSPAHPFILARPASAPRQ